MKDTLAKILKHAPRPVLRWACVPGAIWAMGAGDALGMGLDNTARGIVLAFILSVYGVREFGKIKGLQ